MSKFPHFDHIAIKLVFELAQKVDNEFAGKIIESLVHGLKLTVLETLEYKFKPYGLTKVLILSQSHLICHTWPEFGAIHFDLMTCSDHLDFSNLKALLEEFSPAELQIEELKY